ncbi:MAG: hypothetical protein IKS40_04215 [Treponema sp.]|nr:hypothetical protein [Treponema sp.]
MEKFFEHDIELVLTSHVHSRDIATTYNGKKDSLPEDINTALDKLAAKLITDKEGDTEEVKTQHANLRKSLILLLKGYLNFDKVINSIVNDTTAYGQSDKQDQTDDIETTIKLKRVAAN